MLPNGWEDAIEASCGVVGSGRWRASYDSWTSTPRAIDGLQRRPNAKRGKLANCISCFKGLPKGETLPAFWICTASISAVLHELSGPIYPFRPTLNSS